MAAMHYTVMVERSSVKVFFSRYLVVYFTFNKVNTLKNYKIEKPKNMYFEKIMTSLLIRVTYVV